jgi:hypothetical protein
MYNKKRVRQRNIKNILMFKRASRLHVKINVILHGCVPLNLVFVGPKTYIFFIKEKKIESNILVHKSYS